MASAHQQITLALDDYETEIKALYGDEKTSHANGVADILRRAARALSGSENTDLIQSALHREIKSGNTGGVADILEEFGDMGDWDLAFKRLKTKISQNSLPRFLKHMSRALVREVPNILCTRESSTDSDAAIDALCQNEINSRCAQTAARAGIGTSTK
jgi:hypothetical protein